MYNEALDIDYFNTLSKNHFPEFLGINLTKVEQAKLIGQMEIKKKFFAPNGFLHAGSIISLADTIAGYATLAHLPDKGKSFTTLELKSNFISAAKERFIECECIAEHLGRTTQVWRATVRDKTTLKKIALFSCTQLIIY